MPRWQNQNPMFEVPNVNRQSFNSPNYPDWGAASFSESRRRGSARVKPHHQHSKRNSGGHQQAIWPVERGGGLTLPISPQWQPQPPPPPPPPLPPPSQTYSGFQEQQGPVAVNLSCLPGALCRQNFLEAMLDQAGLADEVMGCVVGEAQETGKAVVYLANFDAALKCVQHFGGRRWASAGPPVIAEVAQGSEPSPPQNTGGDTPNTAGSGSDSPQRQTSTRWADLEDGADDEKDHSDPQSEGPAGSTSAGGSSGRYREESCSFGFGCDVDTDDGF